MVWRPRADRVLRIRFWWSFVQRKGWMRASVSVVDHAHNDDGAILSVFMDMAAVLHGNDGVVC